MSQTAIACAVMRGGTSKGLVFLAEDLPADRATRDAVLLAAMGSPDARADRRHGRRPPADVEGGRGRARRPATTRTSSICSCRCGRTGRRSPTARTAATCSPPSARSRSSRGSCPRPARSRPSGSGCANTQTLATALRPDPGRPGPLRRRRPHRRRARAPTRRSPSSSPTSRVPRAARCSRPATSPTSSRDGSVTCIDNGMPVVCIAASGLGLSGQETPAELEANAEVTRPGRSRSGSPAGPLMNLGDVTSTDRAEDEPAVAAGARRRHLDPDVHPPPRARGDRGARRRVRRHGVPAARDPSRTRSRYIKEEAGGPTDIEVEHPTGFFTVTLEVDGVRRRLRA